MIITVTDLISANCDHHDAIEHRPDQGEHHRRCQTHLEVFVHGFVATGTLALLLFHYVVKRRLGTRKYGLVEEDRRLVQPYLLRNCINSNKQPRHFIQVFLKKYSHLKQTCRSREKGETEEENDEDSYPNSAAVMFRTLLNSPAVFKLTVTILMHGPH